MCFASDAPKTSLQRSRHVDCRLAHGSASGPQRINARQQQIYLRRVSRSRREKGRDMTRMRFGQIGGVLVVGGSVACLIAMTIIVAGDNAGSDLYGFALTILPTAVALIALGALVVGLTGPKPLDGRSIRIGMGMLGAGKPCFMAANAIPVPTARTISRAAAHHRTARRRAGHGRRGARHGVRARADPRVRGAWRGGHERGDRHGSHRIARAWIVPWLGSHRRGRPAGPARRRQPLDLAGPRIGQPHVLLARIPLARMGWLATCSLAAVIIRPDWRGFVAALARRAHRPNASRTAVLLSHSPTTAGNAFWIGTLVPGDGRVRRSGAPPGQRRNPGRRGRRLAPMGPPGAVGPAGLPGSWRR